MAYHSKYPTHSELLEMQKIIPKYLRFTLPEKGLIALALLIFCCSAAYFFDQWRQIDSLVPTHFGVNGEPDAWGDKYSLLGLLVIYLLVMLLLAVVQFFPKYWNIPFRIQEARILTALHQTRLMLAGCQCLVSLLMSYTLLKSLWGGKINLLIMLILFALIIIVVITTLKNLKKLAL